MSGETEPTKWLPEKLEIGSEYGGAYHNGVELVIPESPGIGEEPVADLIPQCCDGKRCGCGGRRYDHRALAAAIVARFNLHAELLAFVELVEGSSLCGCEACVGDCDGAEVQYEARALLARVNS